MTALISTPRFTASTVSPTFPHLRGLVLAHHCVHLLQRSGHDTAMTRS
ncbi:hypothetical protein P3T40_007715 [Paraburkholderia sp. EB58]|jgi:hypothetical protein